MLSTTEENYLKAIFHLSNRSKSSVSTNAIAQHLNTSAASVTDMLKRLTEKGYTSYEKYKGVQLNTSGQKIATKLIRRHRLWEVFMVNHLNFSWDEVHPIAEQLEHIHSDKLIDSLDSFLGFPKYDPHGDPIPDKEGNFAERNQVLLSTLPIGKEGIIVGVNEHSTSFLQYLEQLDLVLGTKVQLIEKFIYDNSMQLLINDSKKQLISQKVSQNLFIKVIES